jgi:methyltransferase (TIGR00027 family)
LHPSSQKPISEPIQATHYNNTEEQILDSSSSAIQHLSAVALYRVLYQAMESERTNVLFQDLNACLLAGPLSIALSQVIENINNAANIIAARTYLIDEMILDLTSLNRVDTIINLGAGLDTRPYRLRLPNSLLWIEVDRPEVISHKEDCLSCIKPLCTVERVKLDIHDLEQRRSLFKTLNIQSKKTLVLTEGLLAYCYPEQVATLAQDLYQNNTFCWWLFELICLPAKLCVRQMRSFHSSLDHHFGADQPEFQCLPKEGIQFFYPYGWRVTESRSILNEMKQLNCIEYLNQLWKPLLRWIYKESWQVFSQRASVVLMERTDGTINPQQSKLWGKVV